MLYVTKVENDVVEKKKTQDVSRQIADIMHCQDEKPWKWGDGPQLYNVYYDPMNHSDFFFTTRHWLFLFYSFSPSIIAAS
jgi:hypothetical protein